MEQLKTCDIGLRFLAAAEFQRQQLGADLLHEPSQTLLIAQDDAQHRDHSQLLHNPLKSMALENMAEFMTQHSRHFLPALGFLDQGAEYDDIPSWQGEGVHDVTLDDGDLECVRVVRYVINKPLADFMYSGHGRSILDNGVLKHKVAISGFSQPLLPLDWDAADGRR